MTVTIQPDAERSTNETLALILSHFNRGEQVQLLVKAGTAKDVVQRFRVALSRSRNRNRSMGRKLNEFVLRSCTYPYTLEGIRMEALVMWAEKLPHHRARELLDDILLERIG